MQSYVSPGFSEWGEDSIPDLAIKLALIVFCQGRMKWVEVNILWSTRRIIIHLGVITFWKALKYKFQICREGSKQKNMTFCFLGCQNIHFLYRLFSPNQNAALEISLWKLPLFNRSNPFFPPWVKINIMTLYILEYIWYENKNNIHINKIKTINFSLSLILQEQFCFISYTVFHEDYYFPQDCFS